MTQVKADCEQAAACAGYAARLAECTARVESKSETTETCTEEFHDFLHCVDHCVAANLFPKLR